MEEKLQSFLEELKKLPKCRNDEYYRFADYFELKCISNKDGIFSQADFKDGAKERSSDLGDGDTDENLRDIKNLTKPQIDDKWEVISRNTLQIIDSRAVNFGDFYPFQIHEDGRSISLLSDLTNRHHLYIFLLCCANLKYTWKFKAELTSGFELISKNSLEKLYPNAEIHFFGSSSSHNYNPGWITNKFWDKLVWLSKITGAKLNVTEDNFRNNNTGDGGLDIFAKMPSIDRETHTHLLFIQCACSPDEWDGKQHSIKDDKWINVLALSTQATPYLFIPQCFRNASFRWFDVTRIHRTNLLDRYRILKQLADEDEWVNYTANPVIKEILKVKESVF